MKKLSFQIFAYSLIFVAHAGKAKSEPENELGNSITSKQLLEIRGRSLSHPCVRKIFNTIPLNKVSEIREESFEIQYKGISGPDGIDIRTHYICHQPPVEIVTFESRTHSPGFAHAPYVELIRIGYPQNGKLIGYATTLASIETKSASRSEQNAYFKKMVHATEALYPYGIRADMSPIAIDSLCARPYSPGSRSLTIRGDGCIKFFEDPLSPIPITVWFQEGTVCGVDIHTWGQRDEAEQIGADDPTTAPQSNPSSNETPKPKP